MTGKKLNYTKSTGNVYEDMGLTNADERMAKAKLAMRIESIINKRGLKQKEAADILGINQPKISALMNGRLSGFSMERLFHFLNLLDQDIDIVIKSKPGKHTANGHLKVAFS